jgi:hypothetical protein
MNDEPDGWTSIPCQCEIDREVAWPVHQTRDGSLSSQRMSARRLHDKQFGKPKPARDRNEFTVLISMQADRINPKIDATEGTVSENGTTERINRS